MPSYKTHSIKNNKKLSFIIEGESVEQVKRALSADGFIVVTIEPIEEGLEEENSFFFIALQDNKNRVEGTIHANDIFQAYKILKEDYKYTLLKLYPSLLTDKKEQDFIFQNVLDISSGTSEDNKIIDKNSTVETTTSSEIILLKKYFNTLIPLIKNSNLLEKEKILYDIKKVTLTSSMSSMADLMKRTTRILYDQSDTPIKKEIYKTILPLAKQTHAFILPPWYFVVTENITKLSSIFKILFLSENIDDIQKKQKEKIKSTASSVAIQKSHSPEKRIFTNNNIKILLQKKYRSSWLDIFKKEGGHSYFYSLMRQVKILFWLKILQEYIGKIATCTGFFLVLGFLIMSVLMSMQFLFFNNIMIPLGCLLFVSLVFSVKEI